MQDQILSVDYMEETKGKNSSDKSNIDKAGTIIKWALVIAMAAFLVYIVVALLPVVIPLLKSGDSAAMEAYIENAGAKGVVILVALQVLQTITIFFPGLPIYMASGVIYGRIWGSVICYITYVVVNCAVFLFARKLGEKADELLSSRKDSDKTKSYSGLLQRTRHPKLFVAALCMIPVIPNGLVPYLVAKSKLSFRDFAQSVALGCIPCVVIFVACGNLLVSGYFWWIVGLMIAVAALTLIFYLLRNKLGDWASGMMEKIFGRSDESEEK